MFNLIKILYNKIICEDGLEPVQQLKYMWGMPDGYIIYQSAVFYMNYRDTKRKVIVHGSPPKGCSDHDHIFYHGVIVPFMAKLNDVNGTCKYKTKEDALNSLKLLSVQVGLQLGPTENQLKESSATESVDNVIYVDFGNSLDDV